MNTGTVQRCLTIEEIVECQSSPASDPRRAHLESCPRCWARLASWREFVTAAPAPAEAKLEETREAIGAALSREIGAEVVAPSILEFPRRARRRGGWPKWWSAAAALIAVGALALTLNRGSMFGERPSVLRGEGASATMGAAVVTLLEPARGAEGAITLRWHAVSGAGQYRVTFLGADLGELASLGPTTDTTITLSRGSLPAALVSGATVRYEVSALADGSPVATSGVGLVRLP